ncbi:hypothetical protein [Nostoc sp.]|uniref:hypothetical protein n=1 Tax=Nostoc sp. TaxID=1180 RepID=UPI002FFB4505
MTEPSKAPFETVLSKGIEKLTSEIFIFLLCYTILLIGMAVLGTKLPTQLRTLLYILPVLGISSYLLLQGQKLKNKTRFREMESNERIAELEAQIKNLEVEAKDIKGSIVGAIEGLPEDASPEVLKALTGIKARINATSVENSAVGGLLYRDDLSKLAKSLDAEAQNDLKGLIMYFQKIINNSKDGGKNLRSLIKNIPQLDEENLSKLKNTSVSLL